MAEVYGVKPKIFTKEWWPYFWMYYKWHTIGAVFVALCIIITAVQCVNREKFDVTVTYAGTAYMLDGAVDKLEIALSELTEDIDGDGENKAFVQQLNMGSDQANAELNYALQTKHDISLGESTSHLYIYDKEQGDIMISVREQAEATYTPITKWYEGDFDSSEVLLSKNGVPLGISLKDSKLLEKCGIDGDGLYVTVKICNGDKGEDVSSYNSAVAMAKAMLE